MKVEMDVQKEIKYLKTKINKVERQYYSSMKYIKLLWAKIDKLEKDKQ